MKKTSLEYQIDRLLDPEGNTGKIILSIRGRKGKHTLYKTVPYNSVNGEDLTIECADEGTADVFLKLRGGDTSGSISPAQMASTKTWVSTKRIGK